MRGFGRYEAVAPALNQTPPIRNVCLDRITRRPIPDYPYETDCMTGNFSAKNGECTNKEFILGMRGFDPPDHQRRHGVNRELRPGL